MLPLIPTLLSILMTTESCAWLGHSLLGTIYNLFRLWVLFVLSWFPAAGVEVGFFSSYSNRALLCSPYYRAVKLTIFCYSR